MGLPFQVLNTSTTRKQKLAKPNPTIAELVLAKHPLSFKQSVLQQHPISSIGSVNLSHGIDWKLPDFPKIKGDNLISIPPTDNSLDLDFENEIDLHKSLYNPPPNSRQPDN